MPLLVCGPPSGLGLIRASAPSTKSAVIRALAAFAVRGDGVVVRSGADGGDVEAMIEGLRALGAEIDLLPRALIVRRGVRRGRSVDSAVHIEDGGAPARFLTAVAALGAGSVRLTTGRRLAERPFGELCAALRDLGADVRASPPDDRPPLVVRGPLRGGGVASALGTTTGQFVSALLLAAPGAMEPCEIECVGELRSSGYVDATVRTLRAAGARVHARPGWWCVEPGFVDGGAEIEAPVDWSSAAPLLAAAAFLERPVGVRRLRQDSDQPDAAFMTIARRLGMTAEADGEGVVFAGRPCRGGVVDLGACPDLAPTVAALAVLAPEPVLVAGAPHLRAKESDRIAALVALLRAFGVDAEERSDGFLVKGGGDRPIDRSVFVAPRTGDHRMVHAAALLGLLRPARIDDAECVAKSFPEFWREFPAETRSEE